MSGSRCALSAKARPLQALIPFATLAILLLSRPAAADGQDYHEHVEEPVMPSWFTLPIEYGDSAAWAKGRSGPVYRFSAGLFPGATYGRLTFHIALQALYRNPNWDVGTGGRATFLVAALAGGFLPLRVLAESSYLPINQAANFSGGAMIGIGSLLQISELYGYDTDLKTSSLGVRIGVDLAALGDPIAALTRYVPEQDFRPLR